MASTKKRLKIKDPSPDVVLGSVLAAVAAAASVTQVILSIRESGRASYRRRRGNKQKVINWAVSVRFLLSEISALDRFAQSSLQSNNSQFRVGGRVFLTDSDRRYFTEITRKIFSQSTKCFDTSAALQDALLADVDGFPRYAEHQLASAFDDLRKASEACLKNSVSMWEMREGLGLISKAKETLEGLTSLEELLLKFIDS